MTIRSASVLSAANIGTLQTLITAAIAAGATQISNVAREGNKYVCVVSTDANQTVYATDGAIDPTAGTAVLTKGSAGAYTLAAPTTAQNGTTLTLINGSAFAHVLTATNLLEDGITGGAKDTATFGAFKGASLSLEAYNGTWFVKVKNVVTIAAV